MRLFNVRVLASSVVAVFLINSNRRKWFQFLVLALAMLGVGLAGVQPSYAQEETTRGKIAGIIRDEAGKPIVGARVQIISKLKDTHYDLVTDQNGHYESTWLMESPDYIVRTEARNYKVGFTVVAVKIGQVTNGDQTLQGIDPGLPLLESQVDVERIANLPLDGREALNSTKFEAEVLAQDAGRLDGTKSGNFAVAIDKVSGLDSRYTLDGVEYNDETHGARDAGRGTEPLHLQTRHLLHRRRRKEEVVRSGGDGLADFMGIHGRSLARIYSGDECDSARSRRTADGLLPSAGKDRV